MDTYYIWRKTFNFYNNEFEKYWDNEPYEKALELWEMGSGPKPEEHIKCNFCQEMGIEKLGDDFWFFETRFPYDIPERLVRDYGMIDVSEFEKACIERSVQNDNTIFAVNAKTYPNLNPARCKSMVYIGKFKFYN